MALGRPVVASSVDEGTSAESAVDGGTTTSWNSAPMKDVTHSDTSGDDDAQTPQWLYVDLGVSGTQLSSIQVIFKSNKVWAQQYEIQTSDEAPNPETGEAGWTTVASVSRASAFATLTQGAGQNIASPSSYADTITASTTPALEQATLGRYVRLYVEKTNWQAPGVNVNIAEFVVNGVNSLRPLSDELDKLKTETVYVEGGKLVFPEAPEGVVYSAYGSELENVITNDGTVTGQNMGPRDVTIIVRASRAGDPDDYVQKNLVVTVPDNSATAAYADMVPSGSNKKPEVIPTIQEWAGGSGSFVLADGAKIVLNDRAGVGLSGVADNMTADVKEISGIGLATVSGAAPVAGGIYIETLPADEAAAYALGDEGYLLSVAEDGIRIYTGTYTGAIYGTITVEQILWQAADHASVPCGLARDYPAYAVRGVKLDIARTPYRYEQLEDYAKIMLWYKMSEYDLHVNDNDNANINGATFDTHAGFHRIESDTYPSLAEMSGTKHAGIPEDLVNADYYNNNEDYQGNPVYTKDQWRALTQLFGSYGMHLLTEIDLPGHSLLYNKYAEENPDNIGWLNGGTMLSPSAVSNSGYLELLDLTGENSERALRFARGLWNEYTDPANPTIYGNVVGIGSDEYWVHNAETYNAFANFANEMRGVIQGNLGADTKIRMRGAGSTAFSTAEETLGMTTEELAKNFQLDIWYPGYDNAKQRVAEGYDVVNCRDAYMYGNPGRTFRDVPSAEYLFNEWNPAIFDAGQPGENTNTLVGDPHLLGAKAVIWGDQSQKGMTERDVHQRVLRASAIVSERSWGGTEEDDAFDSYELRASRLAEGPGTSIAMDVKSESSLVASYDFGNVTDGGATVLDASGNGYTATLEGVNVRNGWASFDGSDLMKTGVKIVSYPYTVSFDLRLSAEDGAANTQESSLFSGYDGRIQVAGHNGNMSADVNYFTRDLGYRFPSDGSEHTVTIVGTMQATRLYVDGTLATFLSQKADQDGVRPGAVSTLYSSVPLPLEKIGQGLHGDIANIDVYNKALSAEEVAAMVSGSGDDGMVNVAQDAHAGGMSRHAGDAFDNADSRVRVAFKAIDGEAFPVPGDPSAAPDGSGSEIYSYWKGNHPDSSLTVDLGEPRTFSEVQIQWRDGGMGRDFKILTSDDGEAWAEAKNVVGNQDYFETVTLDETVTARFVKFQGVASNAGSGAYLIQELRVMQAVDKDDLADKVAAAEDLAAEKNITAASTGDAESALWASLIEARAQLRSPLALSDDVSRAGDRLAAAVERLGDDAPETFTITATAGKGGTITPSGTVEVTAGESTSFSIAASEGYRIADVTVDGVSVGAVESYAFKDVDAPHAIAATFAKASAPEPEPQPGAHAVTVVLGNGRANLTLTVGDGEPLGEPAAPTRAGYRFAGWFRTVDPKTGALSDPYDFSSPVTGDLTLYAGWLPEGGGRAGEQPATSDSAGTSAQAAKAVSKKGLPEAGDATPLHTLVASALLGAAALGSGVLLRWRRSR